MARDRLSALHDNLLCSHILSKLPLRDAVRCSILSRRWRSLWTSLPHLKFLNADFTEKVIANIMCLHHGDLESLEISVSRYGNFNWSPNDELIWKSVLVASVKRVKQITLRFPVSLHVPTSLFSCDCLTFLDLTHFEFKLPSNFSGFSYLRTCFLSDVHIIDDMLEQLAAKCPLLEKLRVLSCSMGLDNLKISAPSLKYFDFSGNRYKNSLTLTVNCPKLRNMTIQNCPSMLKLELNSCPELHLSTTEFHVLKGLSDGNSLRKITLRGLSTRVPSLAVLGRFSNLEELYIESNSFEAASPAIGSLPLPLMTNLKKVRIRVSRLDEQEIALIACLLRNAPSLQTMTVSLPICSEYVHEQRFLKQLLGLNRSSGQATVHITANCGDKCKRCLGYSTVDAQRTFSVDEVTISSSFSDSDYEEEDAISFPDDEEENGISSDDDEEDTILLEDAISFSDDEEENTISSDDDEEEDTISSDDDDTISSSEEDTISSDDDEEQDTISSDDDEEENTSSDDDEEENTSSDDNEEEITISLEEKDTIPSDDDDEDTIYYDAEENTISSHDNDDENTISSQFLDENTISSQFL